VYNINTVVNATSLKRKEGDMCSSYDETNTMVVSEDKISTSAGDSPLWDWLVQYRNSELEPEGYIHGKDGFFGDIQIKISSLGSPFSFYSNAFSFISSFIGWIAFAMHFLKGCRR
jgi:hypothetical protein